MSGLLTRPRRPSFPRVFPRGIRARTSLAAGALTAAVALTACTGTDGQSSGSPTSSATTSPSAPGSPGAFPSPAPTGADLGAIGAAYPIGAKDDVVDGIDWREPGWVRPAANSGFYSEDASMPDKVGVRALDVTWRQIEPTKGRLDLTGQGQAQGLSMDSMHDQLEDPTPFWVRIFASGVDWAPEWVATECRVSGFDPDYDGMSHLPIWDDCVWKNLLATYREVFVTRGLRDDPRLRFVYVPGAFTWAEYDSETINSAVRQGKLTREKYNAWFSHAWQDLAEIMGPQAHKLVFTGEDYTWSEAMGDDVATFAKRATAAGIGIRNGIPEVSNFHLSEAPAYGSHIEADGHLSLDESLPVHDGRHVIGMENECFNDCGFKAEGDNLEYGVVQTNLKSLQLQANWFYVRPVQSYLAQFAPHWDWVRLSMGHTATTSADAWADLRDAEDTYWVDNDLPRFDKDGKVATAWARRPWVRNLERWLVQRDVPGGVARPADVFVRSGLFGKENGVAKEGLSTTLAAGSRGLYLDLDDRFVRTTRGSVQVKVTYWDAAGSFAVKVGERVSPVVRPGGTRSWRTATVTVPISAFAGRMPRATDLAVLASGGSDVVVRFIRVVRLSPPVP